MYQSYKNLLSMNTFGFDVCAATYVEFCDIEQLREIFEKDHSNWYVLGGGSNTLFTSNYDGVIIHPVGQKIDVIKECENFAYIRVEAGVEWDYFVEWCVERGLSGIENLSYIPGSVGASPVQNIGAYGVEAGDVIDSVSFFDVEDREVKVLSCDECRFGYRDSVFKREYRGKIVITDVTYKLNKNFTPNVEYGDLSKRLEGRDVTIKSVRDAVIETRKSKLPEPKDIGNGGSFFKNPIISQTQFDLLIAKHPNMPSYRADKGVKIPAGWLIDQSGWKGYVDGCVGVHARQALVLVHYGGGKGQDIVNLANRIIDDIKEKFDILLSPEVNIL